MSENNSNGLAEQSTKIHTTTFYFYSYDGSREVGELEISYSNPDFIVHPTSENVSITTDQGTFTTAIDSSNYNGMPLGLAYNIDATVVDFPVGESRTIDLNRFIGAFGLVGGGDIGKTVTFSAGTEYTGVQPTPLTGVIEITSLPELTQEGMSLAGWFYEEDFVTQAQVGDAVSNDMTLYAKWHHTTLVPLFDEIAQSLRTKLKTTDTIVAGDFPRKILKIGSMPINVATCMEMSAKLTMENVGNSYIFTGETNALYTNGDIYIVEDVGEGRLSFGRYEKGAFPVSPALDDNSWETIRAVSDAEEGANYWAVGDCKAITVNGTVGTLSVDGIYYVYILGFDHNSTVEGEGITFGTFKTALSGGTDICLTDSNYDSGSIDGTKYFNMNHSGDSNIGGWRGCSLRYDILGSTDSRSKDATVTTAINPVANTLMAALPSDLRAVMKPMTIYTDNAGDGGYDYKYEVTATVDYLPLLAEFEVAGKRKEANSFEQEYQKQYEYYKSGNSKVKYQHSNVNSDVNWWTRSPANYIDDPFCAVQKANGISVRIPPRRSLGLAPIFRV